jgi:uncharacterized protein (TIGR02117 family)
MLDRSDALKVGESHGLVAIGWGDRRFYLETPTWSDVKVANVLSAFFGFDETAMHVNWMLRDPAENKRCRKLTLTPHQYESLCQHISRSFVSNDDGRAVPIEAPGYFETDRFYLAEGRYNVLRTCNTWTGTALEAGGVRVGVWTPLPWGVFWQLPE